MSRLRKQDGYTLPELLVGMVLMMIVMFASLTVLDQFRAIRGRTDRRVDLQDSARSTSRQLARSLRNLAASPDLPGVVERADPYDLVFRAVDRPRADTGLNTRNLRRVRYCLDASNPAQGKLYEQTQRWNSTSAPSVPSATDCPTDAWGPARLVADRMTNRAGGIDRPLWIYGRTSTGQISSVKLNLFMNDAPKMRSREVALETGVFLRNQNRAPTAVFTAAAVGIRHILFNGSGSVDPEGQPLDYYWYADNVEVGRGLIFDYLVPAAGNYVVKLEVRDPGGLADRSAAQPVKVQ
jgi:type II secretory pathway pseudopilin PulG